MDIRNTPFRVGQLVVNGDGMLLQVTETKDDATDRPTIVLSDSTGATSYQVWNYPPYCGKRYCNERSDILDIVSIQNKEKVNLIWA